MFADLPDDGREADYALEVSGDERESIVTAIKHCGDETARQAVGLE